MNNIIYAKIEKELLNKIEKYTTKDLVHKLKNDDNCINFMFSLENVSDTNVNHIIPVSHYFKWINKKIKKKKNREHSVEIKSGAQQKSITLQNFMSEKNIFIEFLEKTLTNALINNQIYNTEKIKFLDRVNEHLLQRNINHTYGYYFKINHKNNELSIHHNVEINKEKEFHDDYLKKIKKDIDLEQDSIKELQIYFSFIKAKNDFKLHNRDSRCVDIISLYLNNKEHYWNAINVLFNETLLYLLIFDILREEMLRMSEERYIANYLGIKRLISENFQIDMKKDEKIINLYLNNLKKIMSKSKVENNYFYALINSTFIFNEEYKYAQKDSGLSFLILNSSKNLITGECTILDIERDELGGKVYLTAYDKNTLIISANETFLEQLTENFHHNKERCFIFDLYNKYIEKYNENNNLFLLKN